MIADESATLEQVNAEINRLVEEHRAHCFWFFRRNYLPNTLADRLEALDYLERRSDRALFVRVRKLRQCLLQLSKETFVPS